MKTRDNDAIIKDLLPSREELVRKAENLRSIYGASWVTNVATYLVLLETKREMGICPLRPIKKSDLERYPKIDFMEIDSEQAAME